jgi:molybdopterin-guanine dinucleotide biosynthesis protein A
MDYGIIILAGGEGIRIGEKKAFIKFKNKTLIQHINDKVSKLTKNLVIVIDQVENIKPILDSLEGTKITLDLEPGIGPLMGIYSGMKELSSQYALILPCDSPFVNLDLLRYLIQSANGFDAAIPRWDNEYIEPLHSVYRLAPSLKAIEMALNIGEKRVMDMVKRLSRINYVPIEELREVDPDLDTFFNINYNEDLVIAKGKQMNTTKKANISI